jgi:transposase
MAEQYTAEHVVEAIKGSGGLVSTVASRLGCSRRTVYRYMNRYSTVKEALKEEREKVLDTAEGELVHLIRDRSHPGHTTAIIFYLKTIGKGRGYVERVQLEEYLEQELEWVMDRLERRLDSATFREVCGILAEGGDAIDRWR